MQRLCGPQPGTGAQARYSRCTKRLPARAGPRTRATENPASKPHPPLLRPSRTLGFAPQPLAQLATFPTLDRACAVRQVGLPRLRVPGRPPPATGVAVGWGWLAHPRRRPPKWKPTPTRAGKRPGCAAPCPPARPPPPPAPGAVAGHWRAASMPTCATGKGFECFEASPWGASQVAQGSAMPCAPHDHGPLPRKTQGPRPQRLRRPPLRRCGQRWAKDRKSVEEGTPVPASGSKKRSGGEAEEGGAASLAQKRHKEFSDAPGGATAAARWGCYTSHAAAKQPAFGRRCATRCEHTKCLPTPAQPQGPTRLPSPAHAGRRSPPWPGPAPPSPQPSSLHSSHPSSPPWRRPLRALHRPQRPPRQPRPHPSICSPRRPHSGPRSRCGSLPLGRSPSL